MSKEVVLITGGAGYIGSHAVLAFREVGYSVVVLDDLSTGRRAVVPPDVPFVLGDVGDTNLVSSLIQSHGIDAAVHFAGSIIVPESVSDPLKYYQNNTCKSGSLIQACLDNRVKSLVFSSTAAVYGIPDKVPISEDEPTSPINPYGASKLMTEWILRDTARAHDFNYVALRYFNVAGADPRLRTGQSTPDATHLVKVASQAVVGLRKCIEVFGEDYPTVDGTCVRDYIHVTDLVAAHVDALRHLSANQASLTLNCGYGHGYSVREVLRTVEREAGMRLDLRPAPRRPGDPPILVADSKAIRELFGWQPKHDDIGFIVRTAIDWERKIASERRPDP